MSCDQNSISENAIEFTYLRACDPLKGYLEVTHGCSSTCYRRTDVYAVDLLFLINAFVHLDECSIEQRSP